MVAIKCLTTVSFCITDIEYTVNNGGNFPIVQIVHQATGSFAGACILGSLLTVLLYFSTVTTVASSSRQVWAFSRDQVSASKQSDIANADTMQGFPFSSWIRHVRPSWEIPLNAVSIPPVVVHNPR